MHEHKFCIHKLEFCEHCDTVYCTSCKQEWKKNNTTWAGYGTGGGSITNVPYTYYCNSAGPGVSATCSNTEHKH